MAGGMMAGVVKVGERDLDHERAGDGGLIHNMSAPPKLTITLRPLRPARRADPDDHGPDPATAVASLSLILHAHVDLGPFLTARRFPRSLSQDDRRALIRLVALAQDILGGKHETDRALAGRTDEALQDELLAALQGIDPGPLRLPAFAVVRKCETGSRRARDLEADPARALALLSRVSGNVFVARRVPRLGLLLAAGASFRFYAAPSPEPRKEQP